MAITAARGSRSRARVFQLLAPRAPDLGERLLQWLEAFAGEEGAEGVVFPERIITSTQASQEVQDVVLGFVFQRVHADPRPGMGQGRLQVAGGDALLDARPAGAAVQPFQPRCPLVTPELERLGLHQVGPGEKPACVQRHHTLMTAGVGGLHERVGIGGQGLRGPQPGRRRLHPCIAQLTTEQVESLTQRPAVQRQQDEQRGAHRLAAPLRLRLAVQREGETAERLQADHHEPSPWAMNRIAHPQVILQVHGAPARRCVVPGATGSAGRPAPGTRRFPYSNSNSNSNSNSAVRSPAAATSSPRSRRSTPTRWG
ncbi:MAG: hypothetical protein P8Z36_12790 [Gemmatimonadota bacterium]